MEPQVSGSTSMLVGLMPFFLVFMVMYFLVIRPQKRKQDAQKKMMEDLTKGDRVLTTSGIFGVVVGSKDDVVVIKIAENTKIELLRSAISEVLK